MRSQFNIDVVKGMGLDEFVKAHSFMHEAERIPKKEYETMLKRWFLANVKQGKQVNK